MNPGVSDIIKELDTQFAVVQSVIDPAQLELEISELEQQMEAADFWNDPEHAAQVSAEHTRGRRKLDGFATLRSALDDIHTLVEMAKDSEGAELEELMAELEQTLPPLQAQLGQLQEDALFSGEYDAGPATVSIHAGEGGVDAQDWAQMLQRMYLRFCERRGLHVQLSEVTEGEEAGIKSCTFIVQGDNAYGIFNAEAGVHRLVRQSPFDSAHRRHTSFAQLEVAPYIEGDVDVNIDDSELRIDTYRASGAGGQHVNKTDSAVRITHLPTNTVVQCQNERSQHANKDTAMKMLKGKLLELEIRKRAEMIAAERGEAQNVGYGSQIRSYVLHPYKMVKDLRTRHETGNVDAVLDGELDDFIRAMLLHQTGASAAQTKT